MFWYRAPHASTASCAGLKLTRLRDLFFLGCRRTSLCRPLLSGCERLGQSLCEKPYFCRPRPCPFSDFSDRPVFPSAIADDPDS